MRTSPAATALAAAVIGFVLLSAFAAATDRFPGDLWLTERAQDIDWVAFSRVVDVTEDIGDDPYVIVIWIAAGAAFYFLGGWTAPALFALAGALRMINPLLKEIVGRPRPSADLVEFAEQRSTMSFPSGHSATAFVLFAVIFYFTTVYVLNPAPRLVIQVACMWMIVVVGIERVYSGVHWPSDVIGGYWLGALIVAVIVILHRYLIRRGMATSPTDG